MSTNKLQLILREIDDARLLRQSDPEHYTSVLLQAKEKLTILSLNNPDDSKILYECASVHDMLGLENEAVPYYEKAIALDSLSTEDKRGAYLGLGSTYRCIGEYEKSMGVFTMGMSLFPEDQSLKVFFALSKFNLQDYEGSVQTLLDVIVDSSSCKHVQQYSRAIRYYRDHLNQTW